MASETQARTVTLRAKDNFVYVRQIDPGAALHYVATAVVLALLVAYLAVGGLPEDSRYAFGCGLAWGLLGVLVVRLSPPPAETLWTLVGAYPTTSVREDFAVGTGKRMVLHEAGQYIEERGPLEVSPATYRSLRVLMGREPGDRVSHQAIVSAWLDSVTEPAS